MTMKNRITKTILVTVVAFFAIGVTNAQTCSHTDKNSWTWPGHNHWFLPTWMPNDGASLIVNQRTGAETVVKQNPYVDQWSTSMGGYQGIAAASNDNGDLVFFTNGRKAWKADGTLITDKIYQGNECGSIEHGGSAVHGTMIVRHPLQPNRYYVLTIDDIVNQGNVSENNQNGSCGKGITFAAIDSSGDLVHASVPIETNITSGKQGQFRTTEGFAATFHGNGVDIWITFQPLFKDYYVSYLLTCDGFVTAPVLSGKCTAVHSILHGYGDLDFSPDGSKLATSCQVDQGNALNAPLYGYGALNIYDFDNWTGQITNRKAVWKSQWGTIITTNVLFSADGSEVHYSGFSNAGKVSATGTQASIRASHTTTPYLKNGFSAAAMNYQGIIEQRSTTNAKYAGAGKHGNELGSNDMYIPPLEEPDITEVGPFCDTADVQDLETYWLCSGVNSEKAIKANENTFGYKGPGIGTDDSSRVKGLFDPKVAGEGLHEIVFVYCGVNDTIWIEVKSCASCIDTLVTTTPKLCAGPGATLNLATLVDTANAKGYWTFGTTPSTPSVAATIDSSTTDTLFSAVNPATSFGVYNMIYTVTKDGIECKDSIDIIVNKPPVISVNDSTICAGDPAALFTASSDSTAASYLWADNGSGTAATTTGTTAGLYTVTVTDVHGCVGRDTGRLSVNALPVVAVNDSTICSDSGPALFSATSDTTAANYLWGQNGTGTSATTPGTVAGAYSVLLIDKNGCIGRDTGNLYINQVPVVAVNDSTICAGDPDALFTVTSDSTIQSSIWGDNGSGTAVSTSGSTAGIYTVEVTDNNGCIGRDTGLLVVNAIPIVSVNDSTICAGGATSALFTATSDSTASTYVWSENGTGTAATTTGTTAGNYTATITDVNGCVGTGTGVLKISALPVVSVNDAEICDGDAGATFSVTSDSTVASYAWSVNGTGTNPTATGTTAGNYTVDIIDVNGCAGQATGVLTVHDLPVVTLNGGNVCPNTPFTLTPVVNTLNGPSTYSWDSGETTETIQKQQGTYAVTVTDAKGCIGTASATVVEDPNLTVIIPGPIELCQGEDTLLISNYKSADGYIFAWAANNTPTGDVTESITVNASGTYGVAVNKGNCQGATTVDVVVHSLPTVTVDNPSICLGDAAATITATSATATTYTWSENGTGTVSTTSGTTAGNYTVIVGDVNGCADTATGVLTVNALPTVTVNSETICAGDPAATFTATSATATGYVWSMNGNGTNQTTTGTAAGTYAVEVTDANNCKATGSGELIVKALPVVTVNNETICAGDPAATFSATVDSATTNFTWTEEGTGTDRFTSGTNAGNYTVSIVDVNGCAGQATGVLTVEALPVVGNDPKTICEGDAATVGEVVPNGTYTYLWTNTGNNETTAQISVTVGGSYSRTVTSAAGCVSTSTYDVTENLKPPVDIPDVSFCEDQQIVLRDNTSSANHSYLWTPGNLTGAIATPTTNTTYTIVKTDDATGCFSTTTATATYITIPSTIIVPDTVKICEGDVANLSVSHNANTVLWSTGSTSDYAAVTDEGSYQVTTYIGACFTSDQVYVDVTPYPTSELDKNIENQLICFDEYPSGLTLSANTDLNYTYLWSTGETTNDIDVFEGGKYDVTITNGACPITDQVTITTYCPWTLYVPNAFTPDINGDGINDLFAAKGTNILEYELTVYDRWGLKIFESNDLNEGWDGTYNGNLVQVDVYVWKISFSVETKQGSVKEHKRVGTVTVVR